MGRDIRIIWEAVNLQPLYLSLSLSVSHSLTHITPMNFFFMTLIKNYLFVFIIYKDDCNCNAVVLSL